MIVYLLAALAALLAIIGVGMIYLPAGMIVAALCCAGAAWWAERMLEESK